MLRPLARYFLRLNRHRFVISRARVPALAACFLLGFITHASAATPDRITRPVDATRVRTIGSGVNHLAQPQYDRGAADPGTAMRYMVLMVKPSAAQQADLAQLLADQRNPASPRYHQWLTPEQFGDRFGLSTGDIAKVSAWLQAEGFSIEHQARGRNWIAFSGTAGEVSRAFHTPVHIFQVNGETHFANTADPAVPEVLAGVVGGFLGLNDFHPRPAATQPRPADTLSGNHYLAPADFSTIYDLTPLAQAGLDGTGQSIAVVGESDILTSDLTTFRAHFGLPANSPKFVLYGADPGYTGAQLEGNLDLEWASAIAPKATIYYVYGSDAFGALAYAVDENIAPIVSVSYSGCEVDFAPTGWEPLGQQANAEGITILAASGDSGAAGCDAQDSQPLATLGRSVQFPAVLPEVTGMGGSQFAEGTGTYWSATNAAATQGSALSYIPETAWNQSSSGGLAATGGGASRLYSKPAWQTGLGVPNDSARDVPDLALSAAGHDAYLIYYTGSLYSVGGTSCATPTMAGILALLNQHQIKQGRQSAPGLGNINPQLYRLAQNSPTAFHDIVSGNNIVSCAQGSPDCGAGSFGYTAGPGYDLATGLGSIDANNLFTLWNQAANGVTVSLTASQTRATLNQTVQFTATVAPAGNGTPTGTVSFSILGGPSLGSAPLSTNGANQTASLSVPAYQFELAGSYYVAAQYSGDANFSPGGVLLRIQITTPTGAAAVVVTGPNTVWPALDTDAQGLSWPATLTLSEEAGVAAMVTGFTMDAQTQSLSQYFPSPDIPAGGSLATNVVLRNQSPPLVHTFVFTGVDAAGQTWSRQIAVNYLPVPTYDQYSFTATPLTVLENPANASCPFAVQLNLDNTGGYWDLFSGLFAGTVDISSHLAPIFGTTRLQAWSSLQGTLCQSGIAPPASEYVYAIRSDGFFQQVQVNLAAAPAKPTAITPSPAAITVTAATVGQTAQATLAVGIGDSTQPWTASVHPANPTTGWLTVSQLSGTGPGQIALTASGFGFEPGVYRAIITIQSPNAVPQFVNVPVMFVLGGGSGVSITAVVSPASGRTTGAPGMLLSVFGNNLAPAPLTLTGNPLPFAATSVTATVNGQAAPLLYVSPNQINLQIPYEVGAGPAMLGIVNNGSVAAFQFQVAPSAPAIYTDGNGNLAGNPAVKAGGLATLYLNGAGDVTPAINSGASPPATVTVTPVLPLSVTVGGIPAIVQSEALAPSTVGTTKVNFYAPATLASGPQPVVVTVGGVASPPVNVTVQ
ncbi:MAG: protease pro-enzyme activation domain-containing protein [Bryobacteraceae bacterium]